MVVAGRLDNDRRGMRANGLRDVGPVTMHADCVADERLLERAPRAALRARARRLLYRGEPPLGRLTRLAPRCGDYVAPAAAVAPVPGTDTGGVLGASGGDAGCFAVLVSSVTVSRSSAARRASIGPNIRSEVGGSR